MTPAQNGAIVGIVLNVISLLVFTGFIYAYKDSFTPLTFYSLLGVAIALIVSVYAPTIGTYQTLKGTSYSFEDYTLQIFIPVIVGFSILLSISCMNTIQRMDEYYEFLVICLSSATLLSASLAYTFLLYRIYFNGT